MINNTYFKILDTYKEDCTKNGIKRYRIYYLIETKYGLCKTLEDNFKKGYMPRITSALNPTQYWTNMAKEIHGDKYDYSLAVYINNNTKIKIICPIHGVFEQTSSSHVYKKCGCPKCIGKYKTTEDVLNIFNTSHNYFYNYPGFVFKNNKQRIDIVCPLHGEFNQQISVHFKSGCPTCGKDNLNGNIWSYTEWQKAAEASKNFDTFKVYILKCWDENEEFYKIGKTYTSVKRRYHGPSKLPYKYEIVQEIVFNSARLCCEYEKELHNFNKQYRYFPLKNFTGNKECFTQYALDF